MFLIQITAVRELAEVHEPKLWNWQTCFELLNSRIPYIIIVLFFTETHSKSTFSCNN